MNNCTGGPLFAGDVVFTGSPTPPDGSVEASFGCWQPVSSSALIAGAKTKHNGHRHIFMAQKPL